jgi:hypothetical protein
MRGLPPLREADLCGDKAGRKNAGAAGLVFGMEGEEMTVEELVKKRIGYKYLDANGESPYQHYKYDLTSKTQMVTALDSDETHDCGEGWNLATLRWIADNCLNLDGIIIECSIPQKAKIIVPKNSTGKFRTDIIKIKKVYKIESLYPALKDIRQRLYNYIPQNPITAETMPEQSKIKKILAQVGAQVWAQVWDQVRDQVRDQGWAQVGAQVGDQVWDQVWAQVWDQVWVFAYYAIKLFLDLPYEHPAFDLVRLGIIVVTVDGKVKVFGKDGKFLGEFDE